MNFIMNKIKLLRNEFNMSQEELASKLNLSKGIISLYENGDRKPSLEVLFKLSEIFDCSIDYLVGKSDIKKPEGIKNTKITNNSGLDTNGLDENDFQDLQRHIDYIKKLKENK